MHGNDISSDPSSSTDTVSPHDKNKPEQAKKIRVNNLNNITNNETEQKKPKQKSKKALPIIHLILSECFIPLCLIFASIATLSCTGMFIILIFIVHCYVLETSKKEPKGIYGIITFEFCLFIVIFVFAIIARNDVTKLSKAAIDLGLGFHSRVSKKANFGLAAGTMGWIFCFFDLIFVALSDFESIIKYRTLVFDSPYFKRFNYLFWTLCLAYIGASITCYLYYPLILFQVYTCITQSIFSSPLCNVWIQRIIFFYSTLYSMFLVYQISPVSVGPRVSWVLAYNVISPQAADSFLSIVIVFFAYFSLMLTIKPVVRSMAVAKWMKTFMSVLIVLIMLLTILFAMFFPSWFALVWVFVPLIASFCPVPVIKSVFYRIHTILYSLTFYAILVTFAKYYVTPTRVMIGLGLWRYRDNFAFTCCGSYIAAVLGQIGLYVESNTPCGYEEELDLTTSARGRESTGATSTRDLNPDQVDDGNDDDNDDDDDEPKHRHKSKKHKNKKHKHDIEFDRPRDEQLDVSSNLTESNYYLADTEPQRSKLANKDGDDDNEEDGPEVDDLSDDDYDSAEAEERRKEREIRRAQFKEKMARKRAERKEKIKTKVIPMVIKVFVYLALAGISIVGIIGGFYMDRWTLQITLLVFMVVTLLNLYFSWMFYILQLLMGLLIMVNIFFVAYPNDWESKIPHFYETGLCPTNGMTITAYMWPAYVCFILLTFVTSGHQNLMEHVSPLVGHILFIIDAILHFIYVFVYDTNIFTLLYLLIGIGIMCGVLSNNQSATMIMEMLSSIFVSCQIVILLMSHFADMRNLVSSIIPYRTIIDIHNIERHPTSRSFVLAAILFVSSVALRSGPLPPKTKLTNADHLFFEIKMISRNFYFYLCWIFVFGFSVVNNYPTFLKFLLSLLFVFGRFSQSFFDTIRIAFLVFSVLFLGCQVAWEIFYELIKGKFRDYSVYLGLFLDDTFPITKRQRNGPIGWQLAYILISAINIKHDPPRAQDEKFEKLLPVRIYNAICAMLHYFLPVFVEISLCISCLSNPSIFGYLSYIVMVLVVFKPTLLRKTALIFLILFNICFLVQYLLWLKCPAFLFNFHLTGIINKWGRFLGIVDVKLSALISNMISQIIFTFYLQYNMLFVDYNQRYNDLPDFIKKVLIYFTGYTFEIFIAFIMVILYTIPTFDGVFFVILDAWLIVAALLYHYPHITAVDISSYYTFFVFAARMISRIPCFKPTGVGDYAKRMFDLPFQGTSKYEVKWIFVFILERIMVHLMNSDLNKEAREMFAKHQAYRYIHARQLKVLEKLDQEICTLRYNLDIQQVQDLKTSDPTVFFNGVNTQGMSVLSMESQSMVLNQSEQEHNKKHKAKWYSFLYLKIVLPVIDYLTETLISLIPPICEAGLNVLTLQTTQILMKKDIHSLEAGILYEPEEQEKKFFDELPPSFAVQYDSIGILNNFRYYDHKKRWQILGRYFLAAIRRLAFPFLILIVLIYTYLKPFIFAMLLILYTIGALCSWRLKNLPTIYRIFLITVMTMYVFRCFSEMVLIKEQIQKANNNIKIQKMSINIFSLFGLNPDETSIVEIFVFLGAIWYTCDQLAYSEVFESKWYLHHYSTVLPGFPVEYCYGIIANPVTEYAMEVKDDTPLFKRFINSMKRLGLHDTSHKYWLLLFDLVSLLVLAICWTSWTVKSTAVTGSNGEQNLSGGSLHGVKVDVGYIFILLVHCLFTFVVYYCCISNCYWLLFFTEELWFLYTILISFYYIHSASAQLMQPTLQFYFLLRFVSHLIAAHKVFMSRILAVFTYPDFAHHPYWIIFKNWFMLYLPFAFEFQMLLEWMSKKTCVGLVDYFIVNQLKAKLEVLIAQSIISKRSNPDKYKLKKRFVIGGICLFLLACVIFIPLFFFMQLDGSKDKNPPLSATMSIGISNMPLLYQAQATISSFTQDYQQQIADSGDSSLHAFVSLPQEDLSLLSFPMSSSISFKPPLQDSEAIEQMLRQNDTSLIPFIEFTFYFQQPTTSGNNNLVTSRIQLSNLNRQQRDSFLQILVNQTSITITNMPINIPTIIYAISKHTLGFTDVAQRQIVLDFTTLDQSFISDSDSEAVDQNYDESNYFELNVESTTLDIQFLNPDNQMNIMIYSEPVEKDRFFGGSGVGSGVYVIVILIIAFLVRFLTLGFDDDMWFYRMDMPQKLYRLSIAIQLFRNANMPNEEKDMTDAMIYTIRSHELVLKVTAANSDPS